MPDIFHQFPIAASRERVFQAIATPAGLDAWWTLTSEGEPGDGVQYRFGFGPGYDWGGTVITYEADRAIEWQLSASDQDWEGTRIGFELSERGDKTWVDFHHTGWPQDNEHYRTSCYCWAMYLRILKRHVENGENVPYERRLEA